MQNEKSLARSHVLMHAAIADSAHADVIFSLVNDLRADVARSYGVSIAKVKVEIGLDARSGAASKGTRKSQGKPFACPN